ncbi:hypothetical protein DFH06DRAFT_1364068 [Mycena polygramma]|nr:hypothetical protein DFH06DRAFT_1364068 [Mycena polygramma]
MPEFIDKARSEPLDLEEPPAKRHARSRSLYPVILKSATPVPEEPPVSCCVPPEILQVIFSHVLPPEDMHNPSLHCGPASAWCGAMVTKRVLVLVSKAWYLVGITFLYKDINIRRVTAVAALLETLSTNPRLGEFVRSIDLLAYVPPAYCDDVLSDMEDILELCPAVTSVNQSHPFILPHKGPGDDGTEFDVLDRILVPDLPATVTSLTLGYLVDLDGLKECSARLRDSDRHGSGHPWRVAGTGDCGYGISKRAAGLLALCPLLEHLVLSTRQDVSADVPALQYLDIWHPYAFALGEWHAPPASAFITQDYARFPHLAHEADSADWANSDWTLAYPGLCVRQIYLHSDYPPVWGAKRRRDPFHVHVIRLTDMQVVQKWAATEFGAQAMEGVLREQDAFNDVVRSASGEQAARHAEHVAALEIARERRAHSQSEVQMMFIRSYGAIPRDTKASALEICASFDREGEGDESALDGLEFYSDYSDDDGSEYSCGSVVMMRWTLFDY